MLNCLLEIIIDYIGLIKIELPFYKTHYDKLDLNAILNNPSLRYFINRDVEYVRELDMKRIEELSKTTPIYIPVISLNPNLSKEFIYKNLNYIDWNLFSFNPALTMDLITTCQYFIDKQTIYANPNLSFDYILEHINDINWEYLSQAVNYNIPLSFFREHKNKLNYAWLIENKRIPFKFLLELGIKDWNRLSASPNISLENCEKHIDELNWKHISANEGLPLTVMKNQLLPILSKIFNNIYL